METGFNDFVALVAQMRAAQREYFSTRRQSALESAKRLERAVDEAQGELFGGDCDGGYCYV